MDAQQVIAAIQGGVISAAFLYLVYQLPSMLKDWQAGKKMLADVEMEAENKRQAAFAIERAEDRKSRHDTAELFSKTISDLFFSNKDAVENLTRAITKLELATKMICRFQTMPPTLPSSHELKRPKSASDPNLSGGAT